MSCPNILPLHSCTERDTLNILVSPSSAWSSICFHWFMKPEIPQKTILLWYNLYLKQLQTHKSTKIHWKSRQWPHVHWMGAVTGDSLIVIWILRPVRGQWIMYMSRTYSVGFPTPRVLPSAYPSLFRVLDLSPARGISGPRSPAGFLLLRQDSPQNPGKSHARWNDRSFARSLFTRSSVSVHQLILMPRVFSLKATGQLEGFL